MPALPEILSRVKNLFDLSARPDIIASHLATDLRLRSLAGAVRGPARPRSVRRLRADRPGDSGPARVRPRRDHARRAAGGAVRRAARNPLSRTVSTEPDSRSTCGGPGIRDCSAWHRGSPRGSIRAIAAAVSRRELLLHPGPDPEIAVRALQTYSGIGDWTAQYIAMRALRWPDAFPAGDLVLQKATGERSLNRLRKTAEAWRPGVHTQPCIFGNPSTRLKRRAPMSETVQVCYSTFSSPVGELLLTSCDGMLTGLSMVLKQGRPAPDPNRNGDGMTRHIARCESSSKPFSPVSCRLSNFRFE